MSRFLISKYQTLEAYTPGEQPRDKKYIKLNTNESPYPPSEGVLKAVNSSEAELLRLYPDPTCKVLKGKIAKNYNINPENVFVSNSSDDLLNIAFMAFAGNEKKAYFADITYGFYEVFSALHSVKAEIIPLKDGFKLDCRDYMDLKNGFIVIANPNAPSGLAVSPEEIKEICRKSPECVVLIDEAYVDFGAKSSVSLIGECDNLIVARTFSKSMSMAGARLGFAMANEELIKDLEKIKYSTNPYSVNRITLAAGEAAMDDIDYYRENCRRIIKTREKTMKSLYDLGFTFTDSKANFIFAKTDKMHGREIFDGLKERGILVRRFDKEKISEYLRISVGTSEDMEALIFAVKDILKTAEERTK